MAIRSLIKVEKKRLEALTFLSWVAPMSFGLYLYEALKEPAFVPVFTALSLIPYSWTVKRLGTLTHAINKKDKVIAFVASIAAFLAFQFAYPRCSFFLPLSLSISVFVSITLLALREVLEALLSFALFPLTAFATFSGLDSLKSFAISVIVVYSAISLDLLVRGAYELLPYIEVQGSVEGSKGE
ncbi:hypothetical protein EYM_01705 [Ignicoccus islandicus DSM 13165]|uniref:Uncharacterized protein n=1 Tax=Ignicoccus islandicus DSM 13165 TaxID=940295 RepID=A0A0U3E2U3_9CREN|nr:hypothetical protein [Ignicoccus islandicus]ALU12235.1 hypothetical protein EYM_01705 [Ignicoccus islandicus DSM 13165]